jgi:amidase/aspartyl-tRNA(Asn)/glutamyl-tRNA(Gln) amidotransferase subunit A
MTFPEWQQFTPEQAAREVHHRVSTRLAPVQQRAVLAALAPEPALAEAFARASRNAPLGGVPYFLKDLYPVAGQPMFAGSTFLPEVLPSPEHDSAMVRALRDAGGVLAGRTHLHEFAYGITGENPHYGDCEHPRFPGRTTGGSSSASAAIVAAGIGPLAIGSDTGGSVRLPAAFCGLFGFRLAPRDALIAGAFPLAPSFDTAGWFTADAADMKAAIGALVGVHPSRAEPTGCYLELPGLDPEVAQACRQAARTLGPSADAATRDALLAAFSASVDAYNTTVADEAWAVHRPWAGRFRERYDPGVWQRLNRVHALTPAQRADARLATATIRDAFSQFFRQYDFLMLPASPFAALTKADCTAANRTRILALTAPASIGGLPVLTLPVTLPSGLSTGLQVVVAHPQSPVVSWALSSCPSRRPM